MKKYLATLIIGLFFVGASRAGIILDEPFSYSNGALITVSGGAWSNHSGTIGQVDVASGMVNLTQTETEDINRGLSGAPYNGPMLYGSFVVNFSALPAVGAGTYFAHFSDGGTINFRCRVFATVSGAAAGMFRVGIGNGGASAVVIAKDLMLGSNYVLVVRYNSGNATNSTLWINPGSEGATADRADAVDFTSVVGITAFALRQSNANGGMGVLTLDNLKVGTAFSDVVSGGSSTMNPPTISSIPNQSIPANSSTPAVPFTVIDGETPAGSLSVSAASSNPTLVPVANVVFGGSDSNRTVTVTPAGGQQGSSVITVTVTDSDNNTASRDFIVQVGAPSLSTFTNRSTPKDTATPPIPFTITDPESDPLTLTATSTNAALVPDGNITFGGSGSDRTVTVTPASGASGVTRITVFVSDGFNTASNSFVLTVFPTRGVDLADTFSYPDGSIRTNSAFFWDVHSGNTGETQVLQGKLFLSSTQSEDIHAFLTNSPYLPSEGWILYSSFTVKFSARPTGNGGDYFAHFRNTGNSFAARVYAATNGAASGKLRLGIANNAASVSAILPTDLDTNVTYTVVTRLNVATEQSTLWVNPASETSSNVTATDPSFPTEIWTYAFRQSSGIGAMCIDNLKIGTSFSDVVTSTPALTITQEGANVRIRWSPANGTLQYTDDMNNAPAWHDQTTGQVGPGEYLVAADQAHRFYSLHQ